MIPESWPLRETRNVIPPLNRNAVSREHCDIVGSLIEHAGSTQMCTMIAAGA